MDNKHKLFKEFAGQGEEPLPTTALAVGEDPGLSRLAPKFCPECGTKLPADEEIQSAYTKIKIYGKNSKAVGWDCLCLECDWVGDIWPYSTRFNSTRFNK